MASSGLIGEALAWGRAAQAHELKCGIKLGRSRRNSAFLAKTRLYIPQRISGFIIHFMRLYVVCSRD